MRLFATTVLLSCTAFTAFADELPPEVMASLHHAVQTEDAFVIDAVFAAVEKQYPEHKKTLAALRKTPEVAEAKQAEPAKKETAVVAAKPEKTFWQRWSGEVGGGLNVENGNSKSRSLETDVRGKYEGDIWADLVELESNYRSENDVRTRENYRVYNRLDRKLNEKEFIFLGLLYEKDSFAGYDQRTSETVGYGRKLIERENMHLEVLGSVGMRQTEYTDGADENEVIMLQPEARFKWQITPTLGFAQNLSLTIGEENTVTRSRTELTNQLWGNLNARLQLDIENNSDVPAGTKNTDTDLSVNLVYKF